MAIVSLAISVDSQYVPAIRDAIGERLFQRSPISYPNGPVPATNEEIRLELVRAVREWVKQYQQQKAAATASAAVVEVPVT